MFERVDHWIRNDFDDMVQALAGLLSIPSAKEGGIAGCSFWCQNQTGAGRTASAGRADGILTRSIDIWPDSLNLAKGRQMVAALGHWMWFLRERLDGTRLCLLVTEDRIVLAVH